jgi:hypothetical protein
MALYACSKRANILAANLPVYDFLAPSLLQAPRTSHQIQRSVAAKRYSSAAASNDIHSASPSQPSRTPKDGEDAASNPAPLNKPLTQTQRDFLTSAVCLTHLRNSFQWQQNGLTLLGADSPLSYESTKLANWQQPSSTKVKHPQSSPHIPTCGP